MEVLKTKVHPVKFGLALTAAGQTLNGVGGISSVNGAHGDFVTYTVYTGFFMGAAGVFISTLFTDGSGRLPPMDGDGPNKTVDAVSAREQSPQRMTRLKALFISAMIMITGYTATLTVPLVTTGCNGMPKNPQAVAYVSLQDTWDSASAAMRVYADAAHNGKVRLADQKRIDEAWDKFHASFQGALKLARFNWSASTPPEQDQLAQDVINLINQLNL